MCLKFTQFSCGHLNCDAVPCRKAAARKRATFRCILNAFCPIPDPCTATIKGFNYRSYICSRCESHIPDRPEPDHRPRPETWSNINIHNDQEMRLRGGGCSMSTERLPRQGRTQRANQQQEASRYRLPRDQSNQPRRRARENTLRRHNQPADRNLRRDEGTELTDLRRTYPTQQSSSTR